MLNWIDYSIIAILGLSIIISLVRGFLREVISLATWIVAFWVAFRFSEGLTPIVAKYVATKTIQMPIAFVALFIGVLILGAILNYIVGLFVDKTGISGTDRMIGVVFGVARGVLLIGALLLLANLTRMPEADWWRTSVLIPHFKPVEGWISEVLPDSWKKNLHEAKAKLP